MGCVPLDRVLSRLVWPPCKSGVLLGACWDLVQIGREPFVKLVELWEFLILILLEALVIFCAFPPLFVDVRNIIFLKDMMTRVKSKKSFHAPFDIREVLLVISQVSQVLTLGQLFLNLA